VNDSQSGFRAYSKNSLEIVLRYTSEGYGAETEQLAMAESHGFRIVEVPVLIRYKGLRDTSKKNPFLHAAIIISTILGIGIEKRPLSVFGLTGVVLIGLAIIFGSLTLYYFNETRSFSIPLTLVTFGFGLLGFMLLLMSVVLYELKKIKDKIS
jgi:hypothetical protein